MYGVELCREPEMGSAAAGWAGYAERGEGITSCVTNREVAWNRNKGRANDMKGNAGPRRKEEVQGRSTKGGRVVTVADTC